MKRIFSLILIIVILAGCSTTRVLQSDQYRLAGNNVTVLNDKSYKASSLQPYIKQEANTYFIGKWNPFLYVYNWSKGEGSSWDRFVERLGTAPVVFDSTLVDNSISGMLNHLEYQGYYGSSINSDIRKKRQLAEVDYQVNLGKRYQINEINFDIKDSVLASLMLKNIGGSIIRPGDYLSQELLENESERVAKIFRDNGYYGFTKNYFFYYADSTTVKDKANIVVKLEDYTTNETPDAARPHTQYTIRDVQILPQKGLVVRPTFLSSLNRITPGMLYSESEINNTYERFTSVRLFSTVNIQLDEVDSSQVDCKIILSPSKLQSMKLNLEGSANSTGLFGITPSLSYNHKNIFGGGEQLSVSFRGNFQFKFKDNTRSNEFSVSSSLSFPKFVLLPDHLFDQNIPRTDVTLGFNYQMRPEYTRDIISTSMGYSWNFKKRFYYNLYPLQVNIVRIFNLSEDFYTKFNDPYFYNAYTNHFDIGGSFNMLYTTDPSANPKKSYFYSRFEGDISGNMLSLFDKAFSVSETGQRIIWGIPYSQFARAQVTLGRTLFFGHHNNFAIATRLLAGAGFAYGNSTALPFEKLFYAGGVSSLRGWQTRSVGPGNAPLDRSFSIANQTGDMHLEANIEFRFPLFWKLNGALFVDAGNIWNLNFDGKEIPDDAKDYYFSFDNMFKSAAMSHGFGVRLDFDMILVRLDLGIKSYDPVSASWRLPDQWLKSDGYALHFGIGLPF